jgi:hypothetical protein
MMKRALWALLLVSACQPSRTITVVSRELTHMAHIAPRDAAHWDELLDDNVSKDAPRCLPPVSEVFAAPPGPSLERRIETSMPHYGWVRGPVLYRVGVRDGMWRVALNIALDPSAVGASEILELPDCKAPLDGMTCEGTPYEDDRGVDACPGSGRFRAPATRANLRLMLRRWSRDAEAYFNRDAEQFGIPVRYDFELFLSDDAGERSVDMRTPLWLSCGRTPYFTALRSGWSMPVLAHELGHFLGLLDEYEALSGIFSFYPKTPFAGSEGSRMGLSMKKHTLLFPMHHYLVLRRYHCGHASDPYGEILR